MKAIYNSAFQNVTNELTLANQKGTVLSSGNQAIRVCGDISGNVSGYQSTNNQISFFTNNATNAVAAFDVSGLLIADTNSMWLGTSTAFLQCNHNGTNSSITYDNLNVIVNGTTVANFTTGVTIYPSVTATGCTLATTGTSSFTTLTTTNLSPLTPSTSLILDSNIITNGITTSSLGTNLTTIINNLIKGIMNGSVPVGSIVQ